MIEPLSYTFASVSLDKAGDANPTQSVDLLPDGGTVVLLGLNARASTGQPAEITVTPSSDAGDGDAITVDGTLVVANSGVLGALVSGGPRSLTLTNDGTEAVTVDVLTGLGVA
jgi:hypothetical protein